MNAKKCQSVNAKPRGCLITGDRKREPIKRCSRDRTTVRYRACVSAEVIAGVFLANRVKKFHREDQLRKVNAAGWISFVQVAPFDESVSHSFECCP